EAADLLGHAFGYNDVASRRGHRVAVETQHVDGHASLHSFPPHLRRLPFGIERFCAAINEAERGIRFESRHLCLEFPGVPQIIGIEKGDVLAASRADAGIPRRRYAAIPLSNGTKAVSVRGENVG